MRCTILLFSTLLCTAATAQQASDTLAPAARRSNLQNITIHSKKPFMVQEIDKTVLNVQANLAAIGSNAFELLQQAPGISITAEDNIGMSGKNGVTVLIDGRPTQLSSRELAAFLRSLPGSSIEKIELITNPSGRFDAQGNAGIINIRLKRSKIAGTSGTVTISYTQQVHYRSSIGGSINHRRGRLNLFAAGSFNDNLQHTDGFVQRKITVSGIAKDFYNTTTDQDANRSFNIRTGADWYMNKKSTVGLLFTGFGNNNPFSTPGSTLISSNGIIDSSLNTQNDNYYRNRRWNGNLNYRFADTLGHELNIDADYTAFNNRNDNTLSTAYLNKSGDTYRNALNRLLLATNISIYALKADYVQQLKKINGKIEAGIKTAVVTTSNVLDAALLNRGEMLPDTGRSNVFAYREAVHAAYLNASRQYGKWEYQAGLRAEYSHIRGTSTDLNQQRINKPDTQYLNLFPTLFIQYKAGTKHTLAFAGGRRINRPNYQSLNPFETIYDMYTSEKGNPFLRPAYTWNTELKYMYNAGLSIAVGHNITTDYSQSSTVQNGNYTTVTEENLGRLYNTYFTISSPTPVCSWWEGYITVTGFLNHYKGQITTGSINERTAGLSYYIQQTFTLGKGWKAQASSWYNAPTREGIFRTKGLGSLDLTVRKTILREKGSVRLGIIDVLNTQRWRQSVQFGNLDFALGRKWESRGIRLAFSYNFGSSKYKARERAANADADRIKIK